MCSWLKSIADIINPSNSFTETYLSVFLGFISALAVEAIVSRLNNYKARKQLKKDIKNELKKIEKDNDTYLTTGADKVYLRPYIITVWKGAYSSNAISCLDGLEIFTKILSVYSLIEDANELEKSCFISCYSSQSDEQKKNNAGRTAIDQRGCTKRG